MPAAPDSRSPAEPHGVPRVIEPMLASIGSAPAGGDDWAFEPKWDGVRAIAHVHGHALRLASRNGNDFTDSYPELGALAGAFGATGAVLDGEIVAFDVGRPSFSALQRRLHQRDPATVRRLVGEVPVAYLVFDLLYLDRRPLLSLAYDDRRRFLGQLDLDGPSWSTPPAWTDLSLAEALSATQERGLEGVVAKRRASRYRPGVRSDDWRKFKHARGQEVVVGGWTKGAGARRGGLGALLVGVHEPGGLHYAGKVGTGFDRRARALLVDRLAELDRDRSPFIDAPSSGDDVNWVEPALVVEVRFTEWTADGHLRHPSYRGLRADKDASTVRREAEAVFGSGPVG